MPFNWESEIITCLEEYGHSRGIVQNMRIVIVGIFFFPELTGVGKYTGEMAVYLRQQGHQVHIVTTPPFYPYWKVQKNYKCWKYYRENWQGVQIFRTPLWVPKKPTGIKRLVHQLSFALSSLPVLIGHLFWKPDLILCIIPAFFSAPFALLAARVSRAKAWLHIQDFELDMAKNLGILPTSNLLMNSGFIFERWLLGRFDQVSTISEGMLARLKQKGISHPRPFLFPNWVDTKAIHPLRCENPFRNELGVDPSKLVVLYHGNMGRKQGLSILVEVALRLLDEKDILFILCGEGSERQKLELQAKELSNIRFLNLQPVEKLNQLVNLADIHVLPQRAGAADLVMPSKLTTMLASGRVVIGTADEGTEFGSIIKKVGWLVPPEDPATLTEAIRYLLCNPQERLRLGACGREFVEQNWDREIVFSRFLNQVENIVAKNTSI